MPNYSLHFARSSSIARPALVLTFTQPLARARRYGLSAGLATMPSTARCSAAAKSRRRSRGRGQGSGCERSRPRHFSVRPWRLSSGSARMSLPRSSSGSKAKMAASMVACSTEMRRFERQTPAQRLELSLAMRVQPAPPVPRRTPSPATRAGDGKLRVAGNPVIPPPRQVSPPIG